MPVVIRTRPYDDALYAAVERRGPRAVPVAAFAPARSAQEEVDDLFPD
jgi:hypothetical protein